MGVKNMSLDKQSDYEYAIGAFPREDPKLLNVRDNVRRAAAQRSSGLIVCTLACTAIVLLYTALMRP